MSREPRNVRGLNQKPNEETNSADYLKRVDYWEDKDEEDNTLEAASSDAKGKSKGKS